MRRRGGGRRTGRQPPLAGGIHLKMRPAHIEPLYRHATAHRLGLHSQAAYRQRAEPQAFDRQRQWRQTGRISQQTHSIITIIGEVPTDASY